MESVLPPDPYKALGVPKDADAALIKSTYRKLVLKCHPDKVADVSLKKHAQEEFHKIQQAWEAIGDEDKRRRYDAEFKLEQSRREKLSRSSGAPNVEVKTARYDVRTQAPAGASFPTSSSHRYEEHKPSSRSYDDHYYEERARKYDTYEAYPKHSSSRSSREKDTPIRVTRVSADRTRSDHKKSHDKEQRRDRERRFVSVESESSTDEKVHYEAGYRRRSDDARKRADEDEARRQAADARKRAEEQRRSYDDSKYEPQRKYSDLENNAMNYISRSKADADRPSPGRTSSSRDVRPEYYERGSRRDTVRRSSARPKDRKGIEIVEWEDMKIPSFKHSTSSPAEIHVPRATPQRSFTESSRDHRRTETSPTPQFRRADTMPSVPHASSSRRKEPVTRSSTLRESAAPHGSGPSTAEAYPTVPPPASSTKYYQYSTSSGGVRLSPEDVGVANGHRTVLHEPNRHRTRSPSPLSRPPMGANRPSEGFVKYTTAAPKVSTAPPLNRSATINVSPVRGSDDRGRRLYGEVTSDRLKRESARRQTSFSPDQVSYSQRIGPDDIRWSASRGRDNTERDREYSKPTFTRHATFVY